MSPGNSVSAWLTRRERWLAAGLLALCWVLCLAGALTDRLDRDEHMYLTAAHLVGEHRLYRDFAFLQTPYAVGAYHVLDALSPGDWTLLPARLAKAILAGAMISVLYLLLRRFGARPLLAAGLIGLLYADDLVRGVAALARNYDAAQLVILLAILIAPLRPEGRRAPAQLFACGALAASAIGFKLTYVPLSLVVLGWVALVPLHRRWSSIGWLAAGALGGLLPLLIAFVGVDLQTLRFNLVDYHFLNAEFHVREGYEPYASLFDRLMRGAGTILSPEHRPLGALTLFALAMSVARWSRPDRWQPGPVVAFAACLLGASMFMGGVPRPVQTSYFVPAFFALAIAVAVLSQRLRRPGQHTLLLLCWLLLVIQVAGHAEELWRPISRAADPSRWTGIVAHRAGIELRSLTSGDGPVATTHPLFALEAGRPIYLELATGEFAWRSGFLLDPADRARFHVIATGDLAALLERRPPSAVVSEVDAPWDTELRRWCRLRGWEPTTLADPEIRAWTRPPSAGDR